MNEFWGIWSPEFSIVNYFNSLYILMQKYTTIIFHMVNLYFFFYWNLVFPSITEVTSGIIILLSEKHLNVVLPFCLWLVLPIIVHLKMYSFSLYSWRIFFQKKHIGSYFCLYFKTLLVWFLTPIISVEKSTVLLKVFPWFIQIFNFI